MTMVITFKNVGQGDSIIIEWTFKGQRKIGIIDCNTHCGRNRVLEHLKSNNCRAIDFIILSHPHSDHFSGFNELFEYCENEGIIIQRLFHSSFTEPKYLRSSVKGFKAENELSSFFLKIHQGKKSGLIKYQSFAIDERKPFQLTDDIRLEFIAPSTDEFDKFSTKSFTKSEENKHSASHGNWLSTIVKIYSNDWFVLLTSDAESATLKRALHQGKNRIEGSLILCQAPHHGAKKNHSNEFWRYLKSDSAKCVISVGDNNYGHPSEHVIKKFRQYGYEVYATNAQNLVNDFSDEVRERIHIKDQLLKTIDAFDTINDSTNTHRYIGDKQFKIENNKAIYVQSSF